MGGRIDISKLKVPPEKHELETARYFAALGYDVEFIPPNHTGGISKLHNTLEMRQLLYARGCCFGVRKRCMERACVI